MSTIGDRIADLRIRRGMTQSELGDAIGESKQTIYKYERGIIANIPLAKIEAIAKALRCPPVVLTGWDSEDKMKQEEQHNLLIQLFDHLPKEAQELVIAQLRGIAQSRQDQDSR